MDVATIGISAAINACTTIVLMIIVYSKWVLPYLTRVSNSIPIQVKDSVVPYVDGKMSEIDAKLSDNIEQLKGTIKATQARFQRSINQAEKVLGTMDIDFENEEEVDAARAQLAKSYGLDVAMQAINGLIASRLPNQKKDPEKVSDGWD